MHLLLLLASCAVPETPQPSPAARWLTEFGRERGVSAPVMATMQERRRVPMRNGGAVVRYAAVVDGVEVLESEVNVLVDAEKRPVAWTTGKGFGAALPAGLKEPWPADGREAVTVALRDVYGVTLVPGEVTATGRRDDGWERYTLRPEATGVYLERPARLRKALWPTDTGAEAAWQIEVMGARDTERETSAWELVIRASDGAILRRRSLQADSAFTYRIWADASGIPADSPFADLTPHPTGVPDGTTGTVASPTLVAMDGFNAPQDPWLDAAATETTGNNVDAYTDFDDGSDGYSSGDFRADLTSALTFDYSYDTSLEPTDSQNQGKASIVQAFYVTNWLHDWYYDSGFTETASNAQRSNLGRGGVENDPLLVEVQDDANRKSQNNANMSTPADGESPRMQVYLWSGESESAVSFDSFASDPAFERANFGAGDYNVTAELALDTNSADGCNALSSAVAGKIAVVIRGSCQFTAKAENAQNAGAVGVVIVNNIPGAGPESPGGSSSIVTIPVVGISYDDGVLLKNDMAVGTVNATMYNYQGPRIDAGLDTTVVAHEWGHYLHHRLVSCGQTQCNAMSEGWADFTALHLMIRDGDDLTGAYPMAAYAYQAADDDPVYYGIRRAPYSTDPAINALSFRHIADGEPLPTSHPISGGGDNSEVHAAGEIWASALLDSYVALQNARDASESFDDIRRRMSDIVVAGMALSPSEPTYTDARDALLAAAAAIDADDASVMANAFAGRGMGSCAVSPPLDSKDLVGVVEDFGIHPVVRIDSATLEDGDRSCDDDGHLDGGERGVVRVVVTNAGGVDLVGAELQLSADTAGLVFDTTSTVLPTLAPWESTEVVTTVTEDRSVPAQTRAIITAKILAADACVPETEDNLGVILEADEVLASTAQETFAVDAGIWTLEGSDASTIWARGPATDDPRDYSWIGTDVSGVTDTRLVSPELIVDTASPLVLSVDTRWSFEYSDATAWDGGVLEVSVGGGDWQDVSAWVTPGYGGIISDKADNPLANRNAFIATNPAFPALDTLTLDFGTAFAGQSVRFAFRIGTDQAAGDFGWEIAGVSVSGITNTPFPALVDQMDVCNPSPVADAGPDQTVAAGQSVTLDGSASADPWEDPLTYAWTEGSGIVLDDPTGINPSFTAPKVTVDTTLTFQLRVNDGNSDGVDTVDIRVMAPIDQDGDGIFTTGEIVDCDDSNAAIFPGALEIPGDGVDQNCDTHESCFVDGDGDTFGSSSEVESPDLSCGETGESSVSTDCDDTSASTFPGAPETCNGVDDNCDGLPEEGCEETPKDTPAESCGGCTSGGGFAAGAWGALLAVTLLRRKR